MYKSNLKLTCCKQVLFLFLRSLGERSIAIWMFTVACYALLRNLHSLWTLRFIHIHITEFTLSYLQRRRFQIMRTALPPSAGSQEGGIDTLIVRAYFPTQYFVVLIQLEFYFFFICKGLLLLMILFPFWVLVFYSSYSVLRFHSLN